MEEGRPGGRKIPLHNQKIKRCSSSPLGKEKIQDKDKEKGKKKKKKKKKKKGKKKKKKKKKEKKKKKKNFQLKGNQLVNGERVKMSRSPGENHLQPIFAAKSLLQTENFRSVWGGGGGVKGQRGNRGKNSVGFYHLRSG